MPTKRTTAEFQAFCLEKYGTAPHDKTFYVIKRRSTFTGLTLEQTFYGHSTAYDYITQTYYGLSNLDLKRCRQLATMILRLHDTTPVDFTPFTWTITKGTEII